jgi:hypothetical protein
MMRSPFEPRSPGGSEGYGGPLSPAAGTVVPEVIWLADVKRPSRPLPADPYLLGDAAEEDDLAFDRELMRRDRAGR